MTRKMILAAAACVMASALSAAPASALELPKRAGAGAGNLVESIAYGPRVTAVALTINGRPVPGTRRTATGWRARARALRLCNVALDWRQASGLNPYAICTIVHIGGPSIHYNW